MRMVGYELCKVIKNRKLILFIMILFFFQVVVFLFAQQGSSPYEYRKYSKKFQQEMEKIAYSSTEEAVEKITKFQDIAADFQFHHAFAKKISSAEDVEGYHSYLEETYGKEAVTLAEEQNKGMTMEQSCAYTYFADNWIKQLKYEQQYVEFRKQMKQGNTNSVSLFQKDKSFTEKNTEKTKKAYERLGTISLKPGNQFTVKKYLNHSYSNLFLVVLIFMLAMGVFRMDQENQMMAFLKTQKKGRTKLLGAKLIALGILVVAGVCCMELLRLLTSYVLYGPFDCSMPIQSFENYRNCCLPWNITQFIFAGIAIKCVVGYVLGIFIAGFVLRFEKNWMVYGVMVSILGIEWLLFEKVLSNGTFAILKYANLVQGISGFGLLGTYENCNLFGFPVNKCVIVFVFLTIAWMVGRLHCYFCWNLQKEQKETGKRKVRVQKRIGRISLIDNVLKIYLFHEKKYVLCLAMVCYGLYCACFQSVTTMPTTLTQTNYEAWIQKYQGELTLEKEVAIEKEKKNYDKLWERVAELGYKDKLSAEETAELAALNTKTGLPYDAFCEFLEQYDMVKERKTTGKDARLLNNYCWNRLFQGFAKEGKNMGIACICCTLLCASLFENKRKTRTLSDTTIHGRKRLCRCKYVLGLFFAVTAWICCILPELVRFLRMNPEKDWDASIGNLIIFQNTDVEVLIYIAVIGIYITQLFLCMLCSLVLMYLVDRTNNSFLSIAATGMLVLIALAILHHNKAGVINTWLTVGKHPLFPCFLEIGFCVILGMLIIGYWEKEWGYLKKSGKRKKIGGRAHG